MSSDQIRSFITARNEGEKSLIIQEFDGMGPDEKRAQLAMKKLGLGRWARGASKAIFRYDEEQMAFEKEERQLRGLVDFEAPIEQEEGYTHYAEDDEGDTQGEN